MPLFNTRKNVINSQVPSRDVKYHSVSYSTDPKDTSSAVVSPTYIERLDMVDFIDPTNAIHFTRVVEWNNGVATSTYDIDNIWAPYTTTGVALSKEKDQEYKSTCYRAIVNGAGFSIGDVLEFNVVFDPRNPRSPHYINRTNRSTLWNVFEQSASWVTWAFPNVWTDIVTCEQYSEKQEHPWWVMVSNWNTFTFPSNVVSFTVTAQSWSFDISFDGWATYAMTWRKWSRTWWQGTIETIDVSQIVILSNGDIDIIWETL